MHGHKFVRTPNIDALAETGIEFTNFHAPNFCSPSRAEMLTGRCQLRYGIYKTVGSVSILHKDERTLADLLKDVGYSTGIFGKWHLGMSFPYTPEYRGFDECFVNSSEVGVLEDAYGNTHMDARFWHNGKWVETKGFSTDVLFDHAMKFIDGNKNRPFFCYIPTPALHTLLAFPHPVVAERMKARGVKGSFEKNEFEAYTLIENIDDNIGKILMQLENLGLSDQTIVIVTTDQGMKERWGIQPTEEYPQTSQFDGGNHVFYFLRYPPVVKATGRNTAISGMVDVVPTILDLCGVAVPENLDGRSQQPILEGATHWSDDRMMIFQCPRHQPRDPWVNVSIKTQDFRMQDPDHLYDAQTGDEVSAQFPGEIEKLKAAYNAYWNSLPGKEEILSRHIIGPHITRLCAVDWYKMVKSPKLGEINKAPWAGSVSKITEYNGIWAVEVEQAGRYRFDLRCYPRDATGKTAIEATRVHLTIGSIIAPGTIEPDAN